MFFFLPERQYNLHKALGIVLEMLDFACWRRNLDAWKCLRVIIDKLQSQYVPALTELEVLCLILRLKRLTEKPLV